MSMNVDGFKIDKIETEKLLGVKFNKKLTFDHHISNICKEGGWEETHTHERFFHFAV